MAKDPDSPNVRRSVRKKMPNSELAQRNLIRKESFSNRMSASPPKVKQRLILANKSKLTLSKKRPNVITKKQNKKKKKMMKKKVERKKEPKYNQIAKVVHTNTEDRLHENYQLVPDDILDSNAIKDDPNASMESDPLGMADTFVVSKNAGILCTMNDNCSIYPVYYPTEVENSGVILFNSDLKKKATLKISYPKCFVVLTGRFHIQNHGTFNIGDFIKAPAGMYI